jgi:RNA polymerase sigma-70 factor (ECF subfamily)
VIGSSDELAHLIERVAARDRPAFQTLYNATRKKLLKSALQIVRNRDDADELVQEAYVKVWTRAASYRRGAFSPISWLVAIVRNHALDHLRRRRVPQLELRAGNMVADTRPDPEQLAVWKNLTRVVLDQLDTLPQHKRDAITGAFFEGLTYYELATRQNVPVNTAKTRVHRALHDLRERMLMNH